jgi:hypothetical protein
MISTEILMARPLSRATRNGVAAHPQRFSWVAGYNRPRWYVAENGSPGADHGTRSDCYSWGDEGIGGDPDVVGERYRCRGQPHVRGLDVVARSAEEAVLADRDAAPETNAVDAIAVDERGQRTEIADLKVPRGPDARRGMNYNTLPETCAKKSEQ